MRILQVMPRFILGGAETMAATLALELKRRGEDVQVISLYDHHSALSARMEQAGIPIHYLGKRPGFDIRVIRRLYRKCRELRPDVVHTHLYILSYAALAAKPAGVPRVVHTVHSVAEKEVGPKTRLLHRLWFRRCGVIPVAISPMVQRCVMQIYGLPRERVPMVYNGVDLSRCSPAAHAAQAGGVFRFLHVGRLEEVKNQKALLEAFAGLHAAHPNARLDLLGEGALYAPLQAMIQSRGLQDCVRLPGARDDVFPFYAGADAFVLPSLYEGTPMTLIEAMGCGLPIVASAVGGVPDMFTDGVSALLCTPEPESIAACMERLLRDPALCARLGAAARERAGLFSAENMAAGYLRVYRGERI